MEEKKIIERSRFAESYIRNRYLKDAFDTLEFLIHQDGTSEFAGKLEQLETTYKFMLKYTVEGAEDPDRSTIYNDLIVSAYHLLDQVRESLLTKSSSRLAYSISRIRGSRGESKNLSGFINELENIHDKQQLSELISNSASFDTKTYFFNLESLFNAFWLESFYTEDLSQWFQQIMRSELIAEPEKCLMVTATSLSLWRCFDVTKFKVLLSQMGSESSEIRQRAILGVLIALYIYDKRLEFYPELNHRLELLNEDENFVYSVEKIVIQLIRSKQTEKLTKRMRDEILPEMVKMNPFIKDKLNLDNLLKDDMSEDKNPDWKHIFEDVPGLTDKLEEISDLQMEGADVFMGTFAMLKSFPFFGRLLNWFIPFTTQHPELSLQESKIDDSFTKAITSTRFLCNSDKYSFLFSVGQIPESYRETMSQSLNAELSSFEEASKDEKIINPNLEGEKISNQYIQDLYRFLKLHTHKNDFEDIFSWPLDFHNKSFFSRMIEDKKRWRNIAEYYFAKNYFVEAIEIFDILLEEKPDDLELLQKAGYAHQLLGDYQKALDYYLKVELVKTRDLWTIKKIAYCYRQLHEQDKALQHYKQAESINDENLSVQLAIGHCYLDQKKYDEALKKYFRVEYLDSKNIKVWKPIAWCSFITGKLDQAEKYYQKIMDDNPGFHDYMNYGHVLWCKKDRLKAIELYSKSVGSNTQMEKFLRVFKNDRQLLIEKGIDEGEIPIMLDRLRYKLSEEA